MDNISQTSEQSASPDYSQVPSYLLSADNHNIGNTLGGSWFSPEGIEQAVGNSGKFMTTSVLSGLNSIANSAITVGNFFGAQEEMNDTSKWISSLDDNLGAYYDQNRQAADLVGFIATSFVPGIGGIKVLNAGQKALTAAKASGFIGENLARATGLLVPRTEMYVNLAAQDIINSTATFSRINTNTLKALGSGLTQNVLEGAAFETAVQATMFKSPVLDDQDGWDIVKNIAVGGAVQGVIGGAIEAAKTFGAIKKAVQAANPESKMFTSRSTVSEATPASQRIIINADDISTSPVPVPGTENYERNLKLYNDKIVRAQNDLRTNIHSMSVGGSNTLPNMLADAVHGLDSNQILANFIHADEVGTMSSSLKVEGSLNKAIKELDVAGTKDLSVRYVDLIGETPGRISDSAPSVISIADKVKATAGTSTEDAVKAVVRGYNFNTKTLWSAADQLGITSHTESEARHIWAQSILPEIKDGTKIAVDDIPLLERAYKDKQFNISLVDKKGNVTTGLTDKDLLAHIIKTKDDVANTLMQKMASRGTIPADEQGTGTARIAKIVNMKQSALEGSVNTSNLDDYFAMQSMNQNYKKMLVAKGLKTDLDQIPNTAFLPKVAKISYKTPEELAASNGNVIDGMVWIKQQQKQFQETADRVFASGAEEISANAPVIPESVMLSANIYGGSAGLTSYANDAYGKLGSYMQQVGANVVRPLKAKFRAATSDAFESPLVKLGNKPEAAIEFEVLNNKLSATSEQYVLDTEGYSGQINTLISKKVRDFLAKGNEGEHPVLQPGAEEFIPVKNQETYDAIAAHIGLDGKRTELYKTIRAAQGHGDEKASDVFRPVRPDTKKTPFFAFVKDEKVTGAGHTTMIHAATEKELLELTSKVPTDKGYKVIYKGDAEEFYKAQGEYDYARTLNENYIDSDLKSRGINSQFFPKTDPQKIVNDILQQHLRADDVLATELTRVKYQPVFDWLEDQGKQYSKLESSQYGNFLSRVEKAGTNPYTDYIKTALDVSKASEFPLLQSMNKTLDTAVSKVYGAVQDLFSAAKKPEDLEGIHALLQKAGYNNAYPDAATVALTNHTAPQAVLSKFIRTSNSILSTFTLRLDFLNSINNAIGANILRFTELKHVTDAIKAGDENIAGSLAHLRLPGTGDVVASPTKMVATAVQNLFKDMGTEGRPLLTQYKSEGLVKDSLQQFSSILDDFALKGTESVTDLNSRIQRAFLTAKNLGQVGEKYTGNKFAEEFNRFISANVMQQLTDAAEKLGVLDSASSKAYRNTFVNRVEGNITASQRPVMFQGPIGQAVGLFQSYQFNLMQQMFRYVGEGTAKDAAMLLGLQGTLYGINGMPAFNAINTHIVGNLSGNKNHTDLYDATYGAAGQSAGDFLMYGVPSSIIQTNLYSRGDINPRQLTIIPTKIEDVPIVSAYTKLFTGLKNTLSNVSGGGNVWESLLQGVEHNGISRPLAGLAQVGQATTGNGQVYSTSNKGTILYSNDLMSFASLSRLAGGRPLDEAIVNDSMYRVTAYEAAQKNVKDDLIKAVKTTGIGGQTGSEDQYSKFAEQYAALGGKPAQFNKWMMKEYTAANTPQSEKIRAQLSSPFSQKMQLLMEKRNTGYGATQQDTFSDSNSQ